jgi:hypothetical protein
MPRGWFNYIPGKVDNDPANRGNYTYISRAFVGDCSGAGQACTIYAYYTPGTPQLGITQPAPFSSNLVAYANSSAQSAVDLPNGTGVKRYLYIKAT